MNLNIRHKKGILTMRNFRIALVVIGFVIVLFNDTLGKKEGFVEFLFLYFIAIIVTVAHWLFVNIKAIVKLKNEKTKTELMHLQSQVNPHFFFNMLNNLYGLVDKDSDKAKKLILKLSDMMRYSIYEGQKDHVTLQQEIDFIQNYIELHKMRYHKEIDIQFDIDIDDENLKLMPLLFIILVENAFKHGVEVLRKDAFVHLSVVSTKTEVTLKIANNFDMEAQSDTGIGLENLTRRLELVYPKKHEFSNSIENDRYNATLTLKL
jgi:LytS/YehU family sensor histidine kinase